MSKKKEETKPCSNCNTSGTASVFCPRCNGTCYLPGTLEKCSSCIGGSVRATCPTCGGNGYVTKGGGCFIATATYESPFAPEVIIFKKFRDDILLKSTLGRLTVEFYYLTSPPIALLLRSAPKLRLFVRRHFLDPIYRYLKTKQSK